MNKKDLQVTLGQSDDSNVEELMGSINVDVTTEVNLQNVEFGKSAFVGAPKATVPVNL